MDDDVRQSSTDRYALSQAYRWRAERDQARQELDRLRGKVEAMRPRLVPEGMEWLLEVWPRWSNGEYCRFGDWWKAERYGDYEPRQLRRLVIYTPELLDEWEQGDGESYGYEWDFMRPSELDYRPDKVEPPAPAVLAADLDSWERIEEDAGCTATKYNERRGTIFTTKQQVARDLVRRCRALSERERGE